MKIGVKTIVMTYDDLVKVLDAKSIDVGIMQNKDEIKLPNENDIIK